MLYRGFVAPRTPCLLQRRLPEPGLVGIHQARVPAGLAGRWCLLRKGLYEGRNRSVVVFGYPEPETEKERSPLDYPQVIDCDEREAQKVGSVGGSTVLS